MGLCQSALCDCPTIDPPRAGPGGTLRPRTSVSCCPPPTLLLPSFHICVNCQRSLRRFSNKYVRDAGEYCDKGFGDDARRKLDQAQGTSWHLDRLLSAVQETSVAHVETRAFRAERAPQSSVDAAREFDDGLDFPPTAHPGRELFTGSLFVLLVISFLLWGGWKLISLM